MTDTPTNNPTSDKHEGLVRKQLVSQIALNCVSILAVLIGGVWIAFNALYVKQEQQISAYTLRELEQKTNLAPHVRSKVTATVGEPQGNAGSIVQERVELSNQGTDAQRVILDNGALSVSGIVFMDSMPQFIGEIPMGSTRFEGVLRQVGKFVDIGAGETYDISYIFRLRSPGTYLVRFLAKMQSPYLDRYKEQVGTPALQDYSVGDDQYITVPRPH